MQVFIPYPEPIKVAECLDSRRFNKQIIECNWILDSLYGRSKPNNHPVVKMYANYKDWLTFYRDCLVAYREGNESLATKLSNMADAVRPEWMTEKLCDQHKRRLYEKAPELYPQFKLFGPTTENWYVVGDEVWIYNGGFDRVEPLSFLNI